MTSKRAKIILLGIWLYAAGLAAVKGVAFNWERPNYEILVFVLGFLLPFSVMGLCYCKIFGAARTQARAMKQMAMPNEPNRELKAAKTIAVVILAFFLCWAPFFLLNLFYGLLPSWQIPKVLITVSKWLHYANSALNPIIYACFNREYRQAFRALLTRKMHIRGGISNGFALRSRSLVKKSDTASLPLRQTTTPMDNTQDERSQNSISAKESSV